MRTRLEMEPIRRRQAIVPSGIGGNLFNTSILRFIVTAAIGSVSQIASAQSQLSFPLEQMHESQGLVGISFVVALVLISTVTALLHLTGRKQWTQRETALTAEATSLRSGLDRANIFLSAEPQIVIAWGTANGEPDIEGDLSLVSDAPAPRRVLGFGSAPYEVFLSVVTFLDSVHGLTHPCLLGH